MKLIAITMPAFFNGEAAAINRLFANGSISLLHLRKPDSTIGECRQLLDQISPVWLPSIVVHDHLTLCNEYSLHGIHLNRRNPTPPPCCHGSRSCSCHSLEEVAERKPHMDYVFLSPIFDSISKQGYRSNFSDSMLRKAAAEGIIDHNVVALGGVTRSSLPLLEAYGFGGAAMLGDIWSHLSDYAGA